MTLPRLATLALLVLALICAAVPTAVAGAGWPVWTIAGLLSWALEPAVGPIVVRTRPPQ